MTRWFDVFEDLRVSEQHLVADQHWLGGLDEYAFMKGKQITHLPADAWVKCTDPEADGPADDVLRSHLGLPIVSERLRKELEAHRIRSVQYLPVQVMRFDDDLVATYYIANILSVVPALDLSRSDFTRYPPDYFILRRRGNIFSVRKYALRANRLVDFDIFRVAEYPIPYFVSERFKKLYEAGSFSGLDFQRVEVTGC